MEELLNRALDIVFNIDWLKVVPEGAIFLNHPNDNVLCLTAQYHLSKELLENCSDLGHGHCQGGIAAFMREIGRHGHADSFHVRMNRNGSGNKPSSIQPLTQGRLS
jgi:hypothetical protein